MYQKGNNTSDKIILVHYFKYNNALGCKKNISSFTILSNTFTEKPKIKKLSNVELLKELPFYDELKISKNKTAFIGYARSYKIEIVDKRDVIIQLKASIKELLKELLNELEGFKYQITLLSKMKTNGEIEHSLVYFNPTTKTVINDDYKIKHSKKLFID